MVLLSSAAKNGASASGEERRCGSEGAGASLEPKQASSNRIVPMVSTVSETQAARLMLRRGSVFIRLERGQHTNDALGDQLVAGRREMDAVVVAQPLGLAIAIGAVGGELPLIIGD